MLTVCLEDQGYEGFAVYYMLTLVDKDRAVFYKVGRTCGSRLPIRIEDYHQQARWQEHGFVICDVLMMGVSHTEWPAKRAEQHIHGVMKQRKLALCLEESEVYKSDAKGYLVALFHETYNMTVEQFRAEEMYRGPDGHRFVTSVVFDDAP
ncbi:unnamed protein product [Symbiodinium natans]|uniref:GIY-YIG nuclease family protein n=1 Tax=Symbiodinium natans TaxID=878477 RepID=A0A812TYM8_9DINO|nr:unnamed protein product [Symbiodinium natans]